MLDSGRLARQGHCTRSSLDPRLRGSCNAAPRQRTAQHRLTAPVCAASSMVHADPIATLGNAVSASLAADNDPEVVPTIKFTDYTIPQGQLGSIRHDLPLQPADVYRCIGCTKPECQVPTGCPELPWRNVEGGYMRQVLIAKHRVNGIAAETELQEAPILSELMGNRVLLKREDMQQVFSFKVRGAYNRMAQLSPEELARGVVCASAGNHAQGVALAARRLGCRATVCMPVTVQEIKLNAVNRLGAEVELVGETLQESTAYAVAKAEAEGRVFIPPFDDPRIIAGAGTVGEEIMRQCTNWEDLHAVFVPVGGGGLISGVAAYIKALHPTVKIIGVEPYGANSMAASLAAGRRIQLAKVDTFSDGVALKKVGAECYRVCRALLDGVVLVSNASVAAAIGDVCTEKRAILEPAGALAVAGAKAYLQRYNIKDKTVVAITTGGNMSIQRLALVSEMADLGARREAMLVTTLSERPGTLYRWLTAVESAAPDTLYTELKTRSSSGPGETVLWSVAIGEDTEVSTLVNDLNEAGFPTQDISDVEVAQLHLRTVFGGRGTGAASSIPNEEVFQVELPERRNGLVDMVQALTLNGQLPVTLCNYRRSGASFSKMMIGVQLWPTQQEQFDESVKGLGKGFTVTRLAGRNLDVFRLLAV